MNQFPKFADFKNKLKSPHEFFSTEVSLTFSLVAILVVIVIITLVPFARDTFFAKKYPKPPSQAAQPPSTPDEILIKFKAGVSDQAKEKVRGEHTLQKMDEIKQIGVERAKVNPQAKDAVIQALSHNPRVKYAEPNYLLKPQDNPNDPYFINNSQWELQKVSASQAWDISKGNSAVTVAVPDSGVNSNHEDLIGKILPGYNYINGNTDTSDQNGHGTAVIGVITASTNNGKGVASLGRNVTVIPYMVATSTGSISAYGAAKGIADAADRGAKVANMSWGGSVQSSTLQSGINYGWNKGMVFTAAAGNYGTTPILCPACASNVIAVGGTDASDKWANSNYGTGLDVMAPISAYTTTNAGGYADVSGTSFSSPMVAALAALIFSANPSLTPQQVVDIITSTADKVDASAVGGYSDTTTDNCNGWNQYMGCGRINAYKALSKATGITLPPPDTTPPTVSISSPSSGTTVGGLVDISVNASDNVGVTKVEFYVDNVLLGSDISSPYVASWDTTTLTNGSSHTLTAKAYDNAGNNTTSATVTVIVNNAAPTPTPSASPATISPIPTPTPSTVPQSTDTQAPTISITNPADGTTFERNSQVTIAAQATDNVGIARIEFSVPTSTTPLCTVTTTPYSCSWKLPGKPQATYILTAKAYDPTGNSASASITIHTSP